MIEEILRLIASPEAWIALGTLTFLEIVLGIDNIIFITILVGRLPAEQREKARFFGLALAMGSRILLLLSLAWIMRLVDPLFSLFNQDISGRDLILLGGGIFLVWKSFKEILHLINGHIDSRVEGGQAGFFAIITQIAIIDIVFSLDSVITAVGLVKELAIMILAIVIAVLVMMFAAKSIGAFVDRHPTIKVLALCFLLVVGVLLVAEGVDYHIPKGYVYFAMGFSLAVELLNIKMRKNLQKSH